MLPVGVVQRKEAAAMDATASKKELVCRLKEEALTLFDQAIMPAAARMIASTIIAAVISTVVLKMGG